MQACKLANNPAIIFLSDLTEQGYEKSVRNNYNNSSD